MIKLLRHGIRIWKMVIQLVSKTVFFFVEEKEIHSTSVTALQYWRSLYQNDEELAA